MKRFAVKDLRNVAMPLAGIALAGALVTGCSDKESNPDPVTVEELKGPGKLWINDKGNGTIVLNWTGSNNEDDFDGYNIYGVKATAPGQPAIIGGLKEGSALQLLDEAGEPVDSAKEILKAFNFDPAKGLGLAAPLSSNYSLADAAAGTSGEDKPEFEALPIHSLDGEKRVLPTCKHDGAGICAPTTTANEGQTVSDNNSLYAVNGTISYQQANLQVGSTYCFIVLSTFDRGEEVSQSSSNMACVTPKFSSDVKLDVPTSKTEADYLKLNFLTWIQACSAATDNKCPEPGNAFTTDEPEGNQTIHYAQDPGPIYVEFDTNAKQVFVAGRNSAIADLGFYEKGFDDPTLPTEAPKLVLDKNENKPTGEDIQFPDLKVAPIVNQGGYSIAGQSITMSTGHVYIFAVGDAEAENTPTSFQYVWAYVIDASSGSVRFRIPKIN